MLVTNYTLAKLLPSRQSHFSLFFTLMCTYFQAPDRIILFYLSLFANQNTIGQHGTIAHKKCTICHDAHEIKISFPDCPIKIRLCGTPPLARLSKKKPCPINNQAPTQTTLTDLTSARKKRTGVTVDDKA